MLNEIGIVECNDLIEGALVPEIVRTRLANGHVSLFGDYSVKEIDDAWETVAAPCAKCKKVKVFGHVFAKGCAVDENSAELCKKLQNDNDIKAFING